MGGQFGGGLAQGLAQGVQSGMQQARLAEQQTQLSELQKLQKQTLELQHKWEQQKQTMYATLPPEEQKKALFPKADELDASISQLIKAGLPGATIGPDPIMASSGAATSPTAASPEIAKMVDYAADYHGIPRPLAHAIVSVESGYNPKAVSPKGAMGLAQLMAGTATDLGVKDPYDPYQNVMGGMKYLSEQQSKFGDTAKAVAAYNTGPGTVEAKGITPEGREYLGKVSEALKPKTVQADQPSIAGFTAEDVVRGVLEKKYGVKADEWSPMKGVAGPGGQPFIVPFNKRTKKYDWTAAVPEAVEPKLITQTGPLGARQQIPVNPYTVDGPIPTETGGMKPEEAAKTGLAAVGVSVLNDINSIMFDPYTGEPQWSIIFKANTPGGGIGDGRILRGKYAQAVRAALRPESGAVISKDEIENLIDTYLPGKLDYALGGSARNEIAKTKYDDFRMLLDNLSRMTNPDDVKRLIRDTTSRGKVSQGEKVDVKDKSNIDAFRKRHGL